MPIRHMGMAVRLGARIMAHRARPLRSARAPIKGFIRAGICMTVDNKPAWNREMESFSMIRGSTGARKLVYISWMKWEKDSSRTCWV